MQKTLLGYAHPSITIFARLFVIVPMSLMNSSGNSCFGILTKITMFVNSIAPIYSHIGRGSP
ncbi:MAG: hypothetical protein U5L45_19405 [Saprospiraceae bacterium]|nr:hypothetical protein [Saprospiraceae bacterium]